MHLLATGFLALYLAHLLTDFVLQSDRVVAGKRRGSALSYLEHGGIHFFAAVLSLGFAVPGLWRKIGFYGLLAALTLVHLAMDWTKVRLVNSNKLGDGAAAFFADQSLHFMTVAITACFILPVRLQSKGLPNAMHRLRLDRYPLRNVPRRIACWVMRLNQISTWFNHEA